ncbi:MAG: lipoprotein signal peptidase [Oceanicoccus sp.]|uniref:signal peptidase II n=1 Tax=Oceanicoccus sp. TaxID=2691044 RepID=UPI0026053C3C|nr:signal peptidase II [Oceanicoccus sp.]MCP3908010.1 lipoprotein signal peptidase [Oceanicoccus sp.]MDG1773484.1 signal peptidase II [Oceanicoccus sp.]
MNLTRANSIGLIVAVIIVALDQWTKHLASTELSYGLPVEILPVFNLTLQHNTGAAFSFLADAGGWQRWFFTIVSAVVSIVLVVWISRLRSEQLLMIASLSCILGGAMGNLWDRVVLGYVVDFISVHYESSYFPAFNIADAAITIGAALMILDMILNPEQHKSA